MPNTTEQSTIRGNTLYVGGSGPGNYSSIPEALKDANRWDTIFVYDDSSPYYTDGFTITKAVNLTGENRETTVIIGGDEIYMVGRGGIRIENFTFNNFDTALELRHCNKINMSNNIFLNNKVGISIYGNDADGHSDDNIIANNIFIENSDIALHIKGGSDDNYVYHNNFINNNNNVWANPLDCSNWDNGNSGNFWDDYWGVDSDGNGIGDTPYRVATSNYDYYPLMELYEGFDPDAPNVPTIVGPYKGEPGVEIEYSFVTTDPNGDDVFYYVTWGDGSFEDWFGPFASGNPVTLNHSWDEQERHSIIVRAKDTNGLIGPWGAKHIWIPRTRASNSWLGFLERYPILQNLFSFIVQNR
jgi:hypothetical protein